MLRDKWRIISVLLVSGSFYFFSLFIFFVQDDFWLLAVGQIRTLPEFFSFFSPSSDTVWYRPLSSQVFFFLGRLMFGLDPLPFHSVVLTTHLVTVYLIYRLVNFLHRDWYLAVMSAFIYGIHQVHTVSLSWLATYSFVLGPLLLVLILLFFEHQRYKLALIFFLFGLLTSEIMSVVPLLLLTTQWLSRKSINWIGLTPYVVLTMLMLWLRFVMFPSHVKTGLYQMTVSFRWVSLIKFYMMQLIGFPMLTSSMTLWLRLFTYILVIFFIGIICIGMWRAIKKNIFQSLFMWIGIVFWGMLPFLFFSEHVAPYYMAYALIGVAPLLANFVIQNSRLVGVQWRRLYLMAILAMFFGLHLIGSRWTYESHWIFRRARLAKELVERKDLVHPVGSEEYFSLGAYAAAQVFNKYSK